MGLQIGSIVRWIAQTMAILGGLVLVGMIILTCISILGRSLISIGLGPIPGDFELVEAASAFAVFSFLPWCQLNCGHAAVDIFTNFLPKFINKWIDLFAEVLMGIAIIIIAWKLFDGTLSKSKYGETTFILQFPIWWAYATSLFAALIGCIIAIYMIYVRLGEVMNKTSDINSNSGVGH